MGPHGWPLRLEDPPFLFPPRSRPPSRGGPAVRRGGNPTRRDAPRTVPGLGARSAIGCQAGYAGNSSGSTRDAAVVAAPSTPSTLRTVLCILLRGRGILYTPQPHRLGTPHGRRPGPSSALARPRGPLQGVAHPTDRHNDALRMGSAQARRGRANRPARAIHPPKGSRVAARPNPRGRRRTPLARNGRCAPPRQGSRGAPTLGGHRTRRAAPPRTPSQGQRRDCFEPAEAAMPPRPNHAGRLGRLRSKGRHRKPPPTCPGARGAAAPAGRLLPSAPLPPPPRRGGGGG